jgi:hypothetical protein
MIDQNSIKLELIRRRESNAQLGIATRDNIFDTKLLAVYGEIYTQSLFPGCSRSDLVNQKVWDLKMSDGKTIQVKTRTVYAHNRDSINIDFKELAFDYLMIILLDEKMNHLSDLFLSLDQLTKEIRPKKGGGYRLSNLRTRHQTFKTTNLTNQSKAG